MSFFYTLNAALAKIGQDKKVVAESRTESKSPVAKALETSLAQDLKNLMEDGTGGVNFSGSGSLEEKTNKWIQKAVKPSTKGDLHRALHVPQDETIPRSKIDKATHSKNPHVRHMAQFAKNVAHEDAEIDEVGMAVPTSQQPQPMTVTPTPATGRPQARGTVREGAGSFTPQDIEAAIAYKNPVGHIYTIANGKIRFNLMNMDRNALNKMLSRPLATQQDWDLLKKQMKQALVSQVMEAACPSCHTDPCCCESVGQDVVDRKEKMAKARGDKPGPLKNVARGLKAFVKGEPEPLDEDGEMMDYLQSRAYSKPYNGSADAADAYDGMFGTGIPGMDMEETQNGPHGKPGWLIDAQKKAEGEIDETMTRQHFQHTADLLKHIEDPVKRQELAQHHAGIFKASNPRFDHNKFFKACGLDECGDRKSVV